ncbi:MAG: hypothetical protein FJ030_05745 [Chloroflexi bacterium]|nr:hypothetical protein [Chloroflexota bacterium]
MRVASLLVAAIALAACGTATPTPYVAPDLFSDDFSQDSGLWETFAEPDAKAQIAEGHLSILIAEETTVAFSLAAINLDDFDLTVAASLPNDGSTSSYGVIFRYIDGGNFYRFDITGDGLWGFSRRQDDQWISIIELQASSAIQIGAGTNVLRLVARESDFAFFANGAELGRVADDSLSVGRIGLFASTFDSANARVDFDDLRVVKP